MWFTGLSFFGRGGLGIRRAEKVGFFVPLCSIGRANRNHRIYSMSFAYLR